MWCNAMWPTRDILREVPYIKRMFAFNHRVFCSEGTSHNKWKCQCCVCTTTGDTEQHVHNISTLNTMTHPKYTQKHGPMTRWQTPLNRTELRVGKRTASCEGAWRSWPSVSFPSGRKCWDFRDSALQTIWPLRSAFIAQDALNSGVSSNLIVRKASIANRPKTTI